VVQIVNLSSVRVRRDLPINKHLLQQVTGANDPCCTWVESDHIQMQEGVRVHLQVSVDSSQPVTVRCYGQVIDPATTTLIFNGGSFKAKELAAKVSLGWRAMNQITSCNTSKSSLRKVLLMGRHVRNNVWMWCGIVLPSWTEFCTKVQEDLQEGVCMHKAALHLCTMTALLNVHGA